MAEPVSLSEARAQCSIDESDTTFDALLTTYIAAARVWVENYTGKILVQREVADQHPRFCRFFDLQWGPFDPDTVEIDYVDSDGADATISSLTINGSRIYPAYETAWPVPRLNTGVSVTYTAGYDEVPEPLVQAVLLLVAQWFLVRENVSERQMSEVPMAVRALCDQYRETRL